MYIYIYIYMYIYKYICIYIYINIYMRTNNEEWIRTCLNSKILTDVDWYE